MKDDLRRPREIPVFVVMPPHVLLLDVAGPIEVLQKANLEQDAVRYRIAFIGPAPSVASSIGLAMAGIAALPARLPDGALVVLPGVNDFVPQRPAAERWEAERQEAVIVDWLRTCIRPGIVLMSICSGALSAAAQACSMVMTAPPTTPAAPNWQAWRRAPGCWTTACMWKTANASPAPASRPAST